MSIVSTNNAPHYIWGEQCDGWLLVDTPTLSVIQERVPAGKSETRHRHLKAEQFFYVLSGTVTLEVDGRIFELQAQQGLYVPAQVPHCMHNRAEVDAVFIVTSTPPSQGDRIAADPA